MHAYVCVCTFVYMYVEFTDVELKIMCMQDTDVSSDTDL